MTRITVKLEDAKASLLRERARKYGLRPEDLVTATIDELIARPDPAFEEAARRVLAKNKDLYERLA